MSKSIIHKFHKKLLYRRMSRPSFIVRMFDRLYAINSIFILLIFFKISNGVAQTL